ncbi:uncharacterized protein HRG_04774 [Hirsutella rhossiliensis]|uniref:Uncharacterized protein n=1 Tax=Hirsutella rhossiliensis TaxID=111463 RepID=A0A9P8N1R8_9HYPO|nr:uncharacterized protein HRG_04774 [Hirsutella rhossiliensis]KAH0964346.1 hypothetical protein HRG_04774 [Hirsutella rhossiliensis]
MYLAARVARRGTLRLARRDNDAGARVIDSKHASPPFARSILLDPRAFLASWTPTPLPAAIAPRVFLLRHRRAAFPSPSSASAPSPSPSQSPSPRGEAPTTTGRPGLAIEKGPLSRLKRTRHPDGSTAPSSFHRHARAFVSLATLLRLLLRYRPPSPFAAGLGPSRCISYRLDSSVLEFHLSSSDDGPIVFYFPVFSSVLWIFHIVFHVASHASLSLP